MNECVASMLPGGDEVDRYTGRGRRLKMNEEENTRVAEGRVKENGSDTEVEENGE